ncbi:MAG TPA: hypothetical protein VG738_00595 [Chitinophagaceae bacterium]|nr:hypothetical protein [Chitinophagaceae bacterium]
MKHIRHCIFASACFLLFAANASAQNDTTIAKNDTTSVKNDTTINADTSLVYKDSMRGQRYCEIVLVKVSLPNIIVTVYNSLGVNACPEEQWKNINTDELKKQFGVHTVVANGPRFYLMDKIALYNNDTSVVAFDSLPMKQWAKMRMGINMALSLKKGETYKERPFKMNTVKIFSKGSTVFELTSPEHTYVMESYSQEVDSTLSEAMLPNLQQRLALPAGWAYKVVTLDDDLRLVTVARKEAFGLEDELGNRYQRVD